MKTRFLKQVIALGLGVLIPLQVMAADVSTKNPERKVSDEYAVSISDRHNRRAMAAAASVTTSASVASWRSGASAA